MSRGWNEAKSITARLQQEVASDHRGSAKGFRPLFQRYAEHGRSGLTAALFHNVDSSGEIWEFTKGSLRVFCFIDGGSLLIVSHGIVKKRQKVPPAEVSRAKEAKRRYLQDKRANEITFLEKSDDKGGFRVVR